MNGAEFLARYGGITDFVTHVDRNRSYPVRQATAHPVYEHDRVDRFAELLATGLDSVAAARQMGELMLESHASYGACGLGSDGTDRLVDLATAAGADRGVFGAKITGGGSGGTVAIFGTSAARDVVHDIAREYQIKTGRRTVVFDGSGPGADEIGVLGLANGELDANMGSGC
jgi:L-arabinokinase